MRIYLSAYRLGPRDTALRRDRGRALIVMNALDQYEDRLLSWEREAGDLASELGQPVSVWARGSILTVTTIGSGSCPTVPRLEHISESEKLIELSTSIPGRHGDCTADLAPRTFELDAARDVTGFAVSVTPPR